MDDKGTYSTTREVEMQRLMSEESSGADTDPLSSDYEEAHFDKTSSSQAFWQRPRIPAWRRLVQAWPVRQSSLRRKRDNEAEEDYSEAAKLSTVLPRRRSLMCMVLTSILGIILLSAAFLIISEFGNVDNGAYKAPWDTPHWMDRLFHYPRTFTTNVTTLPCISHNDESRSVPLFEAIANGCTGVEADIYLRHGHVLVGHRRRELTIERTVGNMYISPLMQVMKRVKHTRPRDAGIFDEDRKQTLILMFDFKEDEDADKLFRALEIELDPLRQAHVLSRVEDGKFVPGVITAVISGSAPFHLIKSSRAHDIFFDAPLRWIWKDRSAGAGGSAESTRQARAGSGQGYGGTKDVTNAQVFDQTNSYFASMSFAHSYWPPMFGLTKRQKKEMQEQVEAAHAQGLYVRYWGTYDWPWTRIRERLWRFFDNIGVDIWNVNDLAWFSKGLWRDQSWEQH